MSDWHSLIHATTKVDSTHKASAPGLAPLNHYTLLKLEGPDAAKFLQGQCSADVLALAEKETSFAAHCNAKGRMINCFLLARSGPEEFLLRVPTDTAEATLTQLNKYLIFSKATLKRADGMLGFAIIGPQAPEIAHQLSDSTATFSRHHSKTLTEYWAEANQTAPAIEISNYYTAKRSDWELSCIKLGIAELNAASIEQYLPQELNLDKIGGINFKKGCYTGQEVIARLHYRGKLKKHLYRGRVINDETLDHGTEITLEDGKTSIGHIVLSAQNKKHTEFLALVPDESTSNDTGYIPRLKTDTQKPRKIEWLKLPYAIP